MLALDTDVSFFTGSKMSWQHDTRLLPSCVALYYVLAALTLHDNKELRRGASGDIRPVRHAVTFTDFKEGTNRITNILSKGIQALQLILSTFAFWGDAVVHHFYSCVRRQVYLMQNILHPHGDNRKQLTRDFRNPLCQRRASFGALSYAETIPWIMNLEEEMLLECRSCEVQQRFMRRTTWSSIRAVKMIAAMNYGRHRGLQKIHDLGRRQRFQKSHYTCRRQKLRKINYLWNHRKKIILQKNRRQFKDGGSKNRFLNMIITIKQFFLPLNMDIMKYESYFYLNEADLIKLFSIKIIYKKLVFETHKMPRQVPLDRESSPPRENSKRRYPSRHPGNGTHNERPSNKRMDGKSVLRKVSFNCRCMKRRSKYAISSCRITRKQTPITFWAFIKDSIADKVPKKVPRKPPKRKLIVMLDEPKRFKNILVESSKIHDALNLKDKTRELLDKLFSDSKGTETCTLKPDIPIHVVHPPARERRNEQNRDTSPRVNILKTCCPCQTYLQPSIAGEHSKGKTLTSDEQKDAKSYDSEKSTQSSDPKMSTETDCFKSTVESTEVAKDTNDYKMKVNEQTSGETKDKNKSEVIAQRSQEQNGTSQNEPKSMVPENVLQSTIAALKESPGKPVHQPSIMRTTDTSISSTIHASLNEGALITSVLHTASHNRVTVIDRQSQSQAKSSDKQMCMKGKQSVVQEGPNATNNNKPQRVVMRTQHTDNNWPDKSPSCFVKRREELVTLNGRHYQVQEHPAVSAKHFYVGEEVYAGTQISLSSLSAQQWQESRSGISSQSHFRSGTPINTRVCGNSRSHKYYYPVEDSHRQHENVRNYITRSHNRNDPVISLQRTEKYTGLHKNGGQPHIKEVVYENPEGHIQFVVDDSRKRLERRDVGAVRNVSRGKYTEARIFHTVENTHHSPPRSPRRVEEIKEALQGAILYRDDPPRKMITVKEPYSMSSYHVSKAHQPCIVTVNECNDDCARSQRNVSRKTPKFILQQTVLESAPKDHQYKTRDNYSDPRETYYKKQYDRNLPRYAPNEHIHEESTVPIVKIPIKLHKCVDRQLPSEKQHLERKKDDFTTSDNIHRHSFLEGKVSYHHLRAPNIPSSASEAELSVVGISGRIIHVTSNKRIREKSPETVSKIERIVQSSDRQSDHLGKERICSIHIYKNNNQVHIQPSDITVSATRSSTMYKSSVNVASTDIDISVEMYSGNESDSSTPNFRTLDVNREMHDVKSDVPARDIAPKYNKSGTNKPITGDLLKPDFDRAKCGKQEVQRHYKCLTGPPNLSSTESRIVESELSFNKADEKHEMLLLIGEAHIEEKHGSKVPKFPKILPTNNMTRKSSNGSADKQYPKVALYHKDVSLARKSIRHYNPKVSYASITYDEETGNVTDSSFCGSDWQSGTRTNNSRETYWDSEEAETGSVNSSLYSAQNKDVTSTTSSASDTAKVERYSAPHNELRKNLPIISELSEQIDKINNNNMKYIDDITGSNMKHQNKVQEYLEADNKRPYEDGRRRTANAESKSADIVLDFHPKQGRTANNATQSDSLMNSSTMRDKCRPRQRRRDHELDALPRDRNITESKYIGSNSRNANSGKESELGTRMARQVYQVMRVDCQVAPQYTYNTTKCDEKSKLEQTNPHTKEFINVNSRVLNDVLSTEGQGMKSLYFKNFNDELQHAIRKRFSRGDASTAINPCNAEEKLLSEFNITSLCMSSEEQITQVTEEGYFLSYTSICDISKTTRDSQMADNRNGILDNILQRKTRFSNPNFSCPKSSTNSKRGALEACEGNRSGLTISNNPCIRLTHSEIAIQVSNACRDRNDIMEKKLTAVMFNKAIEKKISFENTGRVQIYVEAINTKMAPATQDQAITHPQNEESYGTKRLVTQVIPEHPLRRFTSLKDSSAYISSIVDLECENISFDIRQQTDSGESCACQDLLAERVNAHELNRISGEDYSSPNTSTKISNSSDKQQSSTLRPFTSRILSKVRMYSTSFQGLERQSEEGTHSHDTNSEISIPKNESRAQNLSTVSRESKHHKKFRKPFSQENEVHLEGCRNNKICHFKPTSLRETPTLIKKEGNKTCPSVLNNTQKLPSSKNPGLTENKWKKDGTCLQHNTSQKVLDKWRREQSEDVAVHSSDRNKFVKQQDVSKGDLEHVRNKSFLQHTFSMCDGEHNIIKNMKEKQVASHDCAEHNALKNKLRREDKCPSRDTENKWRGKGLAEHSTVKRNFSRQRDILKDNAQGKSLCGNSRIIATKRANKTSENSSYYTVKSTTENSLYDTVRSTTENSSYNTVRSTTENSSYNTVRSTRENSSCGTVRSTTGNSSYDRVRSTTENSSSYNTVRSTTENSSYSKVKSGDNKTSSLYVTSGTSEFKLLNNRMEPSMDKLGTENSSYDTVRSTTENSSYSKVKSGENSTSSLYMTSGTSEFKLLNNKMEPSMDKLGTGNSSYDRVRSTTENSSYDRVRSTTENSSYDRVRSTTENSSYDRVRSTTGNSSYDRVRSTTENSSYDRGRSTTENGSYSKAKSGDNTTSSLYVTSGTSEFKLLSNKMKPSMDKLGVNMIPTRVPKYNEYQRQVLRREKNQEKSTKENKLRKKGGTTENSSYSKAISGVNTTTSFYVTSGTSEFKLFNNKMEPSMDKLGVNMIPARVPKYKEYQRQVLRREKIQEKNMKENESHKKRGTTENSSYDRIRSTTENSSYDRVRSTTENNSYDRVRSTTENSSYDRIRSTTENNSYDRVRSATENSSYDRVRSTTENSSYDRGRSTTGNSSYDRVRSATENSSYDRVRSTTENSSYDRVRSTTENTSYDRVRSTTENGSYSKAKSGDNTTSSLYVTSGTSEFKLLNDRMEPSMDKLGVNMIPTRIPKYKESQCQVLRREKRQEKNIKGNKLREEGGTVRSKVKSGDNTISSLYATSGTSKIKCLSNRMEPSMDKLGVNMIPARIPKYKECQSQVLRREKEQEKNMKGNKLREGGVTDKQKISVNYQEKQHKNTITKGVSSMIEEEKSTSNNLSKQNNIHTNKGKKYQKVHDKCSSKARQETLEENKDNKSNQSGALNSAVTSEKKSDCKSRGKCSHGEQPKIHLRANERSVTNKYSKEPRTVSPGKSSYKCRTSSDEKINSPPSRNSSNKNEQSSTKESINAQNQCGTLDHLHNNCEKGDENSFCITTLKRIFELYSNLCRSEKLSEDKVLANNQYHLCTIEAGHKSDQDRKYFANEIMKLISDLCESMGTNVSNLHHPSDLESPLKCPEFSNALSPYRPTGCSKTDHTTSHVDCKDVCNYLPMFRDPTERSKMNQQEKSCDSNGRLPLKESLHAKGYWMGVFPVMLLTKIKGTNDHTNN